MNGVLRRLICGLAILLSSCDGARKLDGQTVGKLRTIWIDSVVEYQPALLDNPQLGSIGVEINVTGPFNLAFSSFVRENNRVEDYIFDENSALCDYYHEPISVFCTQSRRGVWQFRFASSGANRVWDGGAGDDLQVIKEYRKSDNP